MCYHTQFTEPQFSDILNLFHQTIEVQRGSVGGGSGVGDVGIVVVGGDGVCRCVTGFHSSSLFA